MIKYVFDKDAITAIKDAKFADPQQIGEALADIAAAGGGGLRPEKVVEVARNKASPLHRHFEWDDKAAAHQHRLEQARGIIRLIRVDNDDDEPRRAFMSIADRGGVNYRTLDDVQRSIDLQNAILNAAERDLAAFERRYRELKDVCELVSEAKSRVRKRRDKGETRASA